MRYAVVYFSNYGQTQKIAEFTKKFLESKNQVDGSVDIINVSDTHNSIDLDKNVDHIVLGCPIYVGRIPKKLKRWVEGNRNKIDGKMISLFMVSLNAADPSQKAKTTNYELLSTAIKTLKISPSFVASIAGALNYQKYNFFIKFIMKRISTAAGGPTDTTQNFELTKWSDVEEFASAIASKNVESEFYYLKWVAQAKEPKQMSPELNKTVTA